MISLPQRPWPAHRKRDELWENKENENVEKMDNIVKEMWLAQKGAEDRQ